MTQLTSTEGARLLLSEAALPELTAAQALRLVPFMRVTTTHRNSILYRPGGPGNDFMLMLLDGDAVVETQLTGASDWMVVRTLLPGSLFGEMGATDSIARNVVVRATSDVSIASLDDRALEQITDTDANLTFALLRAMLAHVTRRLRAANQKVEALREINHSLGDEWSAHMAADHVTQARLQVLMKLEKQVAARPDDRPRLRRQA